jgi:enoyl-CoA hydratase
MSDQGGEEVLARVEGGVGRLTLNRPRALNALTRNMCEIVSRNLLAWQDDEQVAGVLIDHAGERGFCAGGDIRLIQESGKGDGQAARAFFGDEYRMNELLFRYPKPITAVMDGVTMGGGVGVSQPARWRIATERTLFAMPEADIGLFPDVGAGWYLAHLPGETGLWMALTGARLRGPDCAALGLATHFIESGKLEGFKAALVSGEGVEAALARFASEPGPVPVNDQRADIDRLFAHDTVEEIVQALEADGSPWAQAQLAAIARKCPTTHKVSLREIREGARRASFADEMAAEYRIAVRMVHRHDFIEGVRAVILDKDNSPRWDPASLEEVTEAMVSELFAELPSDEEWTPFPQA